MTIKLGDPDIKKIRSLREKTRAGLMQIKKALHKAKGDETLALELLKEEHPLDSHGFEERTE